MLKLIILNFNFIFFLIRFKDIIGRYVFDITSPQNDACLSWYNSETLTNSQSTYNSNNYIPCPCIQQQIQNSKIFQSSPSLSSSTNNCYSLLSYGYSSTANKQVSNTYLQLSNYT